MFGKTIDKTLLCFIFISLFAVIMFLLKVNTILIIFMISFFLVIYFIYLIKHHKKTKLYLSYKEFIIRAILFGQDYVKTILSEIIYQNAKFKDFDSYIELDKKYIFFNLKFSPLSFDGLVTIYRQAKNAGLEKIIIISAIKDKKVLNLIKYLDIEIKLMDLHPIYRKIKKNDILLKQKSKTTPLSIRYVLLSFFRKQNIKYFIVSALSTFILSFFTLYKSYYIVLSLIALVFAIMNITVNILFEQKNYL